jgi:hypothetical protein
MRDVIPPLYDATRTGKEVRMTPQQRTWTFRVLTLLVILVVIILETR